jgi:hypothetical protein
MGVPDDSRLFPGAASQGPASKQNEEQTQERLHLEARAVEVVVDARAVISLVNRPDHAFFAGRSFPGR